MRCSSTTAALSGAVALAAAGGMAPGTTAPAVVRIVSGCLLAALAWWGVTRAHPAERRRWAWVSAGLTLFIVGDIVFDVVALAADAPPTVSLVDVLYLAGYPAVVVGILAFARASAARSRDGLLDGSILAAAATLVTWQFLVDDDVTDGSVPLVERLVSAAYPLGDAILIAALAWLVLSGSRRDRCTWLLLGGLTVMLGADLGYAITANVGVEVPVRLLDPLYTVAYAAMAVAAFAPRDETRPVPEATGLHPGRLAFLGCALFSAPLVTVVRQLRGEGVNGVLVILSSLAIAVLVLTRLMLLVTERERATSRHRASEARFRMLATGSPVGIFQLDAGGRVTFGNPELARIFGFPLEGGHADDLLAAVVPAHVGAVRSVLTATGTASRGTVQFDLRRPDGTLRTAKLIGAHLAHGGDAEAELLGTVYDVTDEIAARDQAERTAALLDAAPDVIAVADPAGRVLSLNAAGRTLFGDADGPDAPDGLDLLDLFAASSRARLDREVLPTLGRGGSWQGEAELEPAEGFVRPVSLIVVGHTDGDGALTYLSAIARDISDLAAVRARLRHSATHDALTGLANRTAFTERLDQELDDAATTDAPLALLYCDLDGFKGVNDTLSHGVGDQVLIAVAGRLRAAVRDDDCVARLGGDEFVVLLPGAAHGVALACAERIVDSLSEPVLVAAGEARIGVSIGLALTLGGATTGEALLAEADLQQYRAKSAGKGCVRSSVELAAAPAAG